MAILGQSFRLACGPRQFFVFFPHDFLGHLQDHCPSRAGAINIAGAAAINATTTTTSEAA